jgi:ADP-ribose pyrophosphatase YjhB (NUDIX family)
MVTYPTIMGGEPGFRVFAAHPIALQAVIVNDKREILLLSSPRRNGAGQWQVISGGMEANETVLAGVLREAHEEAGADVRLRPLGVFHAQSFAYDEHIPYMVSIYYLLAYEGGRIVPGDDMADAEAKWWSLAALKAANVDFHPSTQMWLLETAVTCYNLWHNQPQPPLQPNYWHA